MDSPAPSEAPTLIIVTGAPGTGKTTLAQRLQLDLGWTLIQKDRIKEALFDASGVSERDITSPLSATLGALAFESLYAIVGELLTREVNCIAEANYVPRFSTEPISKFLHVAQVRQLLCSTPANVSIARYRRRYESGVRHPVHMDAVHAHRRSTDPIPEADIAPIPLDAPLLIVDTQSGYVPTYAAILDFCHGSHAPAETTKTGHPAEAACPVSNPEPVDSGF